MTRVVALLAAVALAGCAGSRAHLAREAELRRRLDERALPVPLEESWTAALRLLAERGFQLVGKDREAAGQPPQSRTLEFLSPGFATRRAGEDGREAATGFGEQCTRYRLWGRPAPGGSQVVFTLLVEVLMDPASNREERDLAMELELWRRIDARGAAAIAALDGAPPSPAPGTAAIAASAAAPASADAAAPGAAGAPAAVAGAALAAAGPGAAAPALHQDPWGSLRFLLGTWEGKGEGRRGTSRVAWTFELLPGGRYLQMRGSAVFDPQPANPAGERHEELSVLSWDRARMKVVWRRFHAEGFVSQLLLEREEGEELAFASEAIEGMPAGFRARQVLRRTGPDELTARLAIAAPGGDLETYSECRLRRVR